MYKPRKAYDDYSYLVKEMEDKFNYLSSVNNKTNSPRRK